VAISEPGVGGHPKHLQTYARPSGNAFLLSGRKTFLTNGPIADAFIVLAVTGREGGKNRYSALSCLGGHRD
jgi:acyl-CoA dehydrogenase